MPSEQEDRESEEARVAKYRGKGKTPKSRGSLPKKGARTVSNRERLPAPVDEPLPRQTPNSCHSKRRGTRNSFNLMNRWMMHWRKLRRSWAR